VEPRVVGDDETNVADASASHNLHHDLAADRIDLEEFAAALQKDSLGPSAIMKTNARDNKHVTVDDEKKAKL
jgi:hypothetical protein